MRERVRREHMASLEAEIVAILGYPLSDLVGAKAKSVTDRFEIAMATASIEQRMELQKGRDSFNAALSYLIEYESEHLN